MTTMTSSQLSDSLELFDCGRGVFVTKGNLRKWLPDVETALFFAKVRELSYTEVGSLLQLLFNSTVLDALMKGDHSTELQDYFVDIVPDGVWDHEVDEHFNANAVEPKGEILPELWKAAEVTIAKSIAEVADKLTNTLSFLPSKEGHMVFRQMATMNRLRPTVGDYRAQILHQAVPDVLVILDDSGSMTEETIKAIINDVVALSFTANAHLALVSNTARHWDPGTYRTEDVLRSCEYGGTRYEQLVPLFQKDWGTVITIADYDSSRSAQQTIARNCTGRIGKVFDISLVGRPSFLAECVGQLADEVQPLLVANGVMRNSWY